MHIVLQAIGQEDGHTQAVRDAADGARCMTQVVNQSDHGIGKGNARKTGADSHGQAGILIGWIFGHHRQAWVDHLDGGQRVDIA